MGILITIENLYDNGVCDEYKIYTGTTYNIDNANYLGNHTLPHTWDGGNYSGVLYVFVEHCDDHIDPPPSSQPKKQGGFQVQLLNIDCKQCPPNPTPRPIDCNLSYSFVEMFTDCTMTASFIEELLTDCTMTASFIEELLTDCTMTASFSEVFDATPLPTSTPNATPESTPNPTATFEPTPSPTYNCFMELLVEEF